MKTENQTNQIEPVQSKTLAWRNLLTKEEDKRRLSIIRFSKDRMEDENQEETTSTTCSDSFLKLRIKETAILISLSLSLSVFPSSCI